MAVSGDTIFDKILRREAKADIVYEDDHVLAFRDVHPQAPVHVLVIPKTRSRTVTDLATRDPLEAGVFLRAVGLVAKHLGLAENGYRVVMNSGPDAQQSVDYLHAHILGGRKLGWPPG